jgi:ribose transport system permease protein
MSPRERLIRKSVAAINLLPLGFFVAVVALFAHLSGRFLTMQNGVNILLQSASVAVLAVGMTFVLLVAGIDLSIGATMYVAAVASAQYFTSFSPWAALGAALLIGAAFGALNALFVVNLRVTAFIATLAMLFVGRGLGLFLANTGTMLPSRAITALARASIAGVPVALALAAAAIAIAAALLRMTPFGRHIYAIGANREGARKAGLNVERTTFAAYMLCAIFAALGGFISLFQLGAASTTFGEGKEFAAVAAAVLGGASLAGGRGGAAGPVFGAILIQTVQSGLVMSGANPYVFPMITALIIFLAVVVDTLRNAFARGLQRRVIRPDG